MEILIDPCRHLPPFGNGPDDERGAAFGIAAGKDAVEVGHEVLVHRHRAALIVFHAEAVEQAILHGSCETHCEENEVRVHLDVAVGNWRELTVLELHPIGVELRYLAVVAGELRGRDTPLSIAAFFVRMRRAELHGPERPGSRAGSLRRRLRE